MNDLQTFMVNSRWLWLAGVELTESMAAVYTRSACLRGGQVGYRHEQDSDLISS